VLDATAAYRMGNQLLAFQEQYFKAFPQTTRQVNGGKRPALGLNQVDPIVGMAIAEAMDGQISLLHVVRETLHGIPGDSARELSLRLSKAQIDYTTAKFLRTRQESPSNLVDIAFGFVPIGRVALGLIADLLVTGTLAHDKALLAAAGRATIDGGSGRIVINIGDLIEAVSLADDADIDPTDAVSALESLIAKHGRLVFKAPSHDDSSQDIDWQLFALQTSKAKTARTRRNGRATMLDLNTLMDSLQNFSMASASMSDLLAAAIGTDAAPSHSAYQVNGTNATPAAAVSAAVYQLDNNIDGGDTDDSDRAIFLMSTSEPMVPCRTCKMDNPTRILVCRNQECRRLIADVWRCAMCKLPTPFSEENCHQWMCKGTKKTKETVTAQEATVYEDRYKARLESERQRRRRENGDRGGGGGKGGVGGKGGRGASE
jgi:hypothetical protein